jgi:hydroxyacylglutathione hydrolase
MRLLALPALDDNYIWVLTRDDGTAVVIDPGDAAPVLAAVEQGLKPVGVLVTHHHDDHIGGITALREYWPSLPVFAPDDTRIGTATQRVGDGNRLSLNGWEFAVIGVPGHTLTHIAFHHPDGAQGGQLFCGDTLFSLGCGRLFEGTPAQMLTSLDTLAVLPANTQVCCTHEYTRSNAIFARVVEPGNTALQQRCQQVETLRREGRPSLPSTLASELACNPFLRVDAPAVRAAVAARLGREPADRVETFAQLRRWKDDFRA